MSKNRERLNPEDQTLISQKGKDYVVSKWQNPCGHKDSHVEVLLEGGAYNLD